jgi:hypothetical protein
MQMESKLALAYIQVIFILSLAAASVRAQSIAVEGKFNLTPHFLCHLISN